MHKRILSIALLVMTCSCVPVAEEAQAEKAPPEQPKHSIRILQKTDLASWSTLEDPVVYVIGVDDQEYVVVGGSHGLAICKK